MSTVAIMFFEFRPKGKEGAWQLFEPWIAKELFDDNPETAFDVMRVGDKEYVSGAEYSAQGCIRDCLTDSTADFYRSGFPDDMSTRLKEYFDKETEKGYMQYVWGRSNVDLRDIRMHIDKSISNYQEMIKSYESKINDTIINDKLDAIINKLNNPDVDISVTPPQDDEGDVYYYREYIEECNESIDDMRYVREFVNGVQKSIENLTGAYYDEYEIRIVYYMS